MSSWIAAATSARTSNRIMIPFYVYYSMFGFQRIGDLAWAAGDMQARGFRSAAPRAVPRSTAKACSTRTATAISWPARSRTASSYDPTFAHEVGVILHHGLKRMVERQENVFFYLTLLNENYAMPGLTAGTEEQIIKGMYLCKPGAEGDRRVQLLGSGTILREPSPPRTPAGDRLGRAGRRLELPVVQRTGARRPGRRALQPAASAGNPAGAVRGATARRHDRPGDRLDRLHEELRRADPSLHAPGPQLQGAGHRRFGRSDFAASCASISRSTVTSS